MKRIAIAALVVGLAACGTKDKTSTTASSTPTTVTPAPVTTPTVTPTPVDTAKKNVAVAKDSVKKVESKQKKHGKK
jgi:ABC-type glycerol-3-phosphate transport system substrate-binding protein